MYVVHVEVVFNTISTESKPDLEVSEMFQKQEVISLGCVQQMFKHVIEKTMKKKKQRKYKNAYSKCWYDCCDVT